MIARSQSGDETRNSQRSANDSYAPLENRGQFSSAVDPPIAPAQIRSAENPRERRPHKAILRRCRERVNGFLLTTDTPLPP